MHNCSGNGRGEFAGGALASDISLLLHLRKYALEMQIQTGAVMMFRAAPMIGSMVAALLALGQPGTVQAETNPKKALFSAAEVKDARQSLKYCTKKGYFDNLGSNKDQIYIACGRKALISGDPALAKAWRDEARKINDARKPEEQTYLVELLLLTGDLYYAEGQYLQARDTYRAIYRNQLELDIMREDVGDYASLNGLLTELDLKLKEQAVEDTRTAHPDVYPVLKLVHEELLGWWDGKPTPSDWSDFEARVHKVLAADPHNEIAHYALAQMDRFREDCPALIRDAQAAIDNSHYDELATLWGLIGNCHYAAARYEAAIEAYDAAIHSAPWQTTLRNNRDNALEAIEMRDHPEAFRFYVAARDGISEPGTPDSLERIEAAWDNINRAVTLSPEFPLARSLRTVLYTRNYLLDAKPDADETRHAADADAMKAYAQNPESIQSAFAMGLAFYRKPKSEFQLTLWRSTQWFNLAKTRAPDDHVSALYFDLASKARYQLSYEEERQREAENAAYARQMQESRRIQEEQARRNANKPDFFSNMQAWCDSIGASSVKIMAAAPPACYGFVK